MKRMFVWIALLASCSGTHRENSATHAPFGSIEPIRLMRLFSACPLPLRVKYRGTVSSIECEVVDAQNASVRTWGLEAIQDGRLDAVELQAPSEPMLRDEAAKLLPLLADGGSSILASTIDPDAGESTTIDGASIAILRDYRGHIGNMPWRFGIRWQVSDGL